MDLTQFLELFDPRPGNHYIEVTCSTDAITDALYELMQSVDGELRIALYDGVESATQEHYRDATIQQIKNFKQPFRALPRDNDMVLFKDILHLHSNPKGILKIAYTTLANNANILILQKKGTIVPEELMQLLEEQEFRCANQIDILQGYDLIVAKKLHMWGAGL